MPEPTNNHKQPDLLSGKPKEPTKEVDSVVPAKISLTPVQKIQSEVIKFATKMWDKERAVEFATRVALIAKDNEKLRIAIERNPDSFLTAYMGSVSLDLMPNTPEALAYIIPYGDKVQFQIGYKGLIKLARRSGEIKTVSAELVFDGDTFDVNLGTDRQIVHKPSFDVDRTNYSKVTHAYATALLTNGENVFAVMTRKELDKIQSTVKSSSTDTPWKQWPERQAIKTVVKRLTQFLPSGKDDLLQRAATIDSLSEAGKLKLSENGDIIEGEVGLSSVVKGKIENAKTTEELQAILNSLSPNDKVLAQPFIEAKFGDL